MNDDDLDALLADPAIWAEPGPDLQGRVVAAITEAGSEGRRRRFRYAGLLVAAAVLVAAGIGIGVVANRDQPVRFAAAMSGTPLAQGVTGKVTLVKTKSGWKIHLHATGLPRRADGEFYEAWLKNDAGVLIPIGTFNDGNDVTLWAGASPENFPLLTVTREVADGNQASSGQVVLIGKTHRS